MRTTQLIAAAVEAAQLAAQGQPYGDLLVARVRSLLGVDGGIAVTSWQLSTGQVHIETDIAAGIPAPSLEMLRRAQEFAPRYAGITAMLEVGTAGPVRVSDVVNLRSSWGTEWFDCMHGHAGRFPAAAALQASGERLVFLENAGSRAPGHDSEPLPARRTCWRGSSTVRRGHGWVSIEGVADDVELPAAVAVVVI